mgnify:FL=1
MEMNINSLITDLAFILVLGAITTVLFKFLKQPVVLGYIVAGFLASPNFALLPSVTTAENIEFWAQLGIIVLLFSLGLEFSFKKLVNAGASAVGTALTIVIGMLATGFCIGKFLGFSDINCIFLGGMLSMSSTTIIIKAFTDLNLRQRKFASIVFAVLIVEDLFAVLMMVILSSIAVNNRVESSDLIYSISKLVFFLVIWFIVGIYILPSLFNATRRFLNSETLLIVSMGLCLGMAVFSVACGFSLALGAFVMGSILAGTSFAERIEHVMLSVKDLFGSIFFISVGMMVDPNVIVEYWAPILLISAAVIMGMIIFGTTGMLLTGQTLRVAIESGFSLTQIGEFAFIIATLGLSLHVLDPTIYPIVVAVSVLTTFTTPYFIRMADPTYRFIERHLPKRLQFLIERYNEKTVNRDEIKTIWKGTLKRYALRLLLYSILLVGITLISLNFFIPWLDSVLGTWGRLIGVIVTLAAMSPFLVAMTMPVANKTEREKLYGSKRGYYLRMFIMRIFRFLLAIYFVIHLLSSVYSLAIGVVFGISGFVLMLILLSKEVHKQVKTIESRFLENLNERDLRRSGRNNNLVADIHLAHIKVGSGCPFIGKKLGESNLRRNYGINVSSIQRGNQQILIPGSEVRIFPGDALGIVGTEEMIQQVTPVIEKEAEETHNALDDVKLHSIQLSEHSPIIGLTSATANLRGKYKALLVNIQRGNQFLPPTGATAFEEGDILWLVGSRKLLKHLK